MIKMKTIIFSMRENTVSSIPEATLLRMPKTGGFSA